MSDSGYGFKIPNPPARLHFVGIGGIGVSGLARLLHDRGYEITGSDLTESEITRKLASENIRVSIGHDAMNVDGADFLITTAAASSENVELTTAVARGIPVVKRAAVLGLLTRDYRTLAVAGSHGKSTTSGMAAVALHMAGYQPGFAVGAIVPAFGTNARDSRGDYFVVEADEYDHSFLQLVPDAAIVTNIEHDHPDLFDDIDHVLDAFLAFTRRIKTGGTLILSSEDAGCKALMKRIDSDQRLRIVTFGEQAGDWTLGSGDAVAGPGNQIFELPLIVPGRHNRLNALSILAAAEGLGIKAGDLAAGLGEFGGVGRRFERIREDEKLVVVSDYAHHPTEIRATIAAAREQYPGRRLLVAFQPHTYSRTKALLSEFADSLDGADIVMLADIYAAREQDNLGVSSESIAALMTTPVKYIGSPGDVSRQAQEIHLDGDVVLILGAGDIYLIAEDVAGKFS